MTFSAQAAPGAPQPAGSRCSSWLGALLALVVGRWLGVRRRHVLSSLRRAGFREVERIADAMYRSLGTGVFELLAMLLSRRRRVPVQGLEQALTQVRALRGRTHSDSGVVIATAHTGNWDLVACALAERVPLTVITKRMSVGWLNRLWQGFRARRGVGLVEAGQAASRARRELQRGGWVAAMIDQAPERRRGTFAVEFLGELAEVDLAPALLAARARCPLVIAFPLRSPSGHSIQLASVLEPPPRAGRAWAERAMREATVALEAMVRQHPEQWLWMHRRWKRAQPA